MQDFYDLVYNIGVYTFLTTVLFNKITFHNNKNNAFIKIIKDIHNFYFL
jgi:hypothetical protein